MSNGVDTFISLEPVIRFDDSLRMIMEFSNRVGFFPQEFRIGLMSGIDKDAFYNWDKCEEFIKKVRQLGAEKGFKVKLKKSIVQYYNKGFFKRYPY